LVTEQIIIHHMTTLNEELRQVPKILYKYISWDNIFHKRILSENEIYFSSFDQFNDPFEGEYPYRFRDEDLTDENIVEFIYQLSLKNGGNYTREFLWEHLDKNPLKQDKYWQKIRPLKEFNKGVGIFCLSKFNDNHLMWSHYANSHNGLCISFNLNYLARDLAVNFRKVAYSENFPRMPLLPKNEAEYLHFLYTKSKDWSYEQEYRFFETRRARTKVNVSNEVFTEIIFGCKMPNSTKQEISILALEKYPGIKLFETAINDEKFQLNIQPYSLSK